MIATVGLVDTHHQEPGSTLAGIPMPLAALAAHRSETETKRLVRELNAAARAHRADEAARAERLRKESDEQLEITKRLGSQGRGRRTGTAAVAAPSPAATASVYDFYRHREAARQDRLAAVSGGRR